MCTLRDGVVLLHGISRTARSFRRMERAVERVGYATLNLDYASRRKALEALAEDIHPAIDHLAGRLDGQVHFVCHSIGGLLARVYLAKYRPPNLGRVVMLGTPNGGSEIADRLKHVVLYRAFFGPAGQQLGTLRDAATMALLPPIDYPVGIIAGNRSIYPVASAFLPRPHDGRVSVANTKLEGMIDHIVVRTSHPWLVRSNEAIAQTIAFLQEGRFEVGS
ncbi:esterase/lipase family protein [Bradyrhizobium cenepequi]|uniref:esterase/lipase family protein n=1 Tax=Bradyrhizobium cenepequi TaxID=2821403 RepID=UPI001CE2F945|nr:alpha/beta fold hydrolase [Bradyrhizobium cenepequi]MCA6112419.1 alpha/beta fold hydrolase [Bradyrhizobium cenepequi]